MPAVQTLAFFAAARARAAAAILRCLRTSVAERISRPAAPPADTSAVQPFCQQQRVAPLERPTSRTQQLQDTLLTRADGWAQSTDGDENLSFLFLAVSVRPFHRVAWAFLFAVAGDPPGRSTSMSNHIGEPVDAARKVVLRWRDPDALDRQEAYRRRHKHPLEMCGHGNRPGSWRALARINRILVVCGGPDCAALAAYTRVLRDARRAGCTAIDRRDGCAACRKSRWHKATRHAATQRRWAEELRRGARLLAERPTLVAQEAAELVEGSEMEDAITAAMTRLA